MLIYSSIDMILANSYKQNSLETIENSFSMQTKKAIGCALNTN